MSVNFCFATLVFFLMACQREKEPTNREATVHWDGLGPGGGGATYIPTFSYQRPEDFTIRCDMTGSYITHDGGQSYDQVNFPNGANAYAYDPFDPNSMWIGSVTLNHSTDGGKTWEIVFPKKEEIVKETYYDDHANYSIETTDSSLYVSGSGHVGTIRIDPFTKGAMYFSMGNYFFYSSDAGKNWDREEIPQRIEYVYTNPGALKNAVVIFTSDALYSFDKTTHQITASKIPASMSPAFSFTAGTEKNTGTVIFYALHHDAKEEIFEEFGHSEVWKSTDHGVTWKPVMSGMVTNKASGIKPSYSMIACAEFDAGEAYLVTNRYEEKKTGDKMLYWYGAMKTADGGGRWEWVWKGGGGSGQYGVKDGIGVSNLKDAWSEKAFGGEYIRLMDVGVSPNDGNIAIVTDWYRAMKTTDGGKTWNEIYSATQPDGTFISRGLDVTTAYSVHFDPFDSNHIAISYTDIGYHHSYNRGKSWVRSTEGVPSPWINTCYDLVFDPDVKDKIWSVWSGMHDFPRGKMTRNPAWKERGMGGVCVSLDGGKSWQPSNEGMGPNAPATSIVMDPRSPAGNRTLFVSVYSKGVFKSTDDGKTWTLKNKGITGNTCAFELTLAENGNLFLTVSATPAHKDGKKGREYLSGEVYKSMDGAETWTRLKVAEGPLFPSGIAVDREDPDRIYLGCWAGIRLTDLVGRDVTRSTGGDDSIPTPGGIFLSEDGGNSWESVFDKKQYVYDVTVDPYHRERLYCNTFNQAAYQSDDKGKTWKKIKGYDFHWGQRIIVDRNEPEAVYITTFGSSVLHGVPVTE